MMNRKIFFLVLIIASFSSFSHAESGYDLWLRYSNIDEKDYLKFTERLFSNVLIIDTSETAGVLKAEITRASLGMTGKKPHFTGKKTRKVSLIIASDPTDLAYGYPYYTEDIHDTGEEGYVIMYKENSPRKTLIIAANSSSGALYGTFQLLRKLQTRVKPATIPCMERPKISHRILNHWDNLDRTVERGYAGFSIWDWHRLPGYIDQRYIDYARANASIGINGTVLTNVNANAYVLTPEYIDKVAALAKVFRPYGIRVYLTARFSAPMEIGGLETADPLNEQVRDWWSRKTKEIYAQIPDFGGFLVKANSEGQPGPQNYGRSHADGANLLADAVKPFGGIVLWRAFVYSNESPEDRAKQANTEFEPLDDTFRDNVVIQVKNGPIDFQPREPFHPLFGAMEETSIALELQVTQEYLGQGTSLAYLAPLFKETLGSKTYRPRKESRVSDIIDGSAFDDSLTVIAGVSNIGNDINWTGHLFGQANWFAYGNLAWNHEMDSRTIAREWIKLTFGMDEALLTPIETMMLMSREAVVNYMTPLGLHHIMGRGHHYGPGPWVTGGRADWTSPYYHRADEEGIGFDRTASGSNALSQYAPEIEDQYSNPRTCPEKYLLWFHHLPWNYSMNNGNTLWDEICIHYDTGVKQVDEMNNHWQSVREFVDFERFEHVEQLLEVQLNEARWWKNACLLYFRQFSDMEYPGSVIPPQGELENYMKLTFPYAPGN